MPVSASEMKTAALRHQWLNFVNDFPALPPMFSTSTFSDSTCSKISALLPGGTNQKFKWKDISRLAPASYKTVRFDKKVRSMDFPHPGPYVNAVETLAKNWDRVSSTMHQTFSTITPKVHVGEPRIVKFSNKYQQPAVARFGVRDAHQIPPFLELDLDFIQGTVLQLDIANFFPSIYTHSLDWSITGNRSDTNSGPGPDIDKAFSNMRTQRTDGVSIGPVTSNIAAEIVLSGIDKFLIGKFESGEIHYTRAVDDFTILLKRNADVEKFVNDFSTELSKVSLSLNGAKQKETKYSDFLAEHITITVKKALHPLVSNSSLSQDPILFSELRRVATGHPDKSVLKYGWKYIRSHSKLSTGKRELSFLTASWEMLASAPHLTAEVISATLKYYPNFMKPALRSYVGPLLEGNLRSGFTDASCWLIYFAIQTNIDLRPTLKNMGFYNEPLLDLRSTWLDSFVAILILEANGTGDAERLKQIFTDKNHRTDERTERWSAFWPVRYELYKRGFLEVEDLEQGESLIFQVLKSEGFSLICRP